MHVSMNIGPSNAIMRDRDGRRLRTAEYPSRPEGDTIDVNDEEALRRWAAWLELEEKALMRLVRIAGSGAGQLEYLLGKSSRSRW